MRKPFVVIVGLLLLWAITPFLLVAVHPSIAGFLHRELAYRVISDRLTIGLTTDLEKTRAVMTYVHLNEAQLEDWSWAEDRDVMHDLVRGIGWCDQKANAMAHLLEKQGVAARMVMFPCHTFAEVRIDGAMKLFDSEYNCHFFLKDSPDEIATLQDLQERSLELMTSSGLEFSAYEKKAVITCGNARPWTFLDEQRPLGKRMLIGLLNGHVALGGMGFASALQEWYFAVSSDAEKANATETQHFRARCMDLLGRTGVALELYKRDRTMRAQYFLFKAQLETGVFEKARRTYSASKAMLAANVADEHGYYSEVQRSYISKLQQLNRKELMAVYGFSAEELEELFRLLDNLEVE
jgi:hypothetical protein